MLSMAVRSPCHATHNDALIPTHFEVALYADLLAHASHPGSQWTLIAEL